MKTQWTYLDLTLNFVQMLNDSIPVSMKIIIIISSSWAVLIQITMKYNFKMFHIVCDQNQVSVLGTETKVQFWHWSRILFSKLKLFILTSFFTITQRPNAAYITIIKSYNDLLVFLQKYSLQNMYFLMHYLCVQFILLMGTSWCMKENSF